MSLELVDEKNIKLSISDNGAGLPGDFDVNQETGLGLKLVTALCTQIKGTLDYKQAALMLAANKLRIQTIALDWMYGDDKTPHGRQITV